MPVYFGMPSSYAIDGTDETPAATKTSGSESMWEIIILRELADSM
jgi:hypothetical protein